MRSPITIANYEEFFLLYMDGELSHPEKQAVEQFVQDNPHLAEEFEMLQQMKLPAEQVDFMDKDLLYRHAGAEISLDNYETHFLLYIDNELDQKGQTAVETFVLQHPSLQDGFMLLKKTKLQPESVVYPAKETLYRKEEKERRVLYMSWQRIAVAAVFIGIIALVWTLVPSGKDTPGQPVAVQGSGIPEPAKTNGNTTNTTGTTQAGNAVAGKNTVTPALPGVNTIQQKKQDAAVNNIAQSQLPVNNTVVPEPQQTEVTARVEPQQTIAATAAPANTGGTINPPAEKINAAVEVISNTTKTEAITAKNTEPDNISIQPAVYKELDTEADDNRKTLYVGSIEINKDKLRGFFRKATSLFRGKAKQQEEERTENAPSSSNTRSLR